MNDDRKAPDIRAVILAAGYSSRMKAFKPLLDVGGLPAVVRLAEAVAAADVRDVIVVTGYRGDETEAALRERRPPDGQDTSVIRAIRNEGYAEGMLSSARVGMRGATRDGRPDAILLFTADNPLIPAWVIKAVIAAWEASPLSLVVPCYRGKKGHPLLIPAPYADEILAHDGAGGVRAITDRYDDRLIRVETEEEGVVLDMDTEEGYEEILRHYERVNGGGETTSPLGPFRGRLILIRHGSTEPHREKIFLGQTDIPLSDRGREEAKVAGQALARLNARTDRIYASDLSRAKETAEIVAEAIADGAEPQIVATPRFREMHLGGWDGRYISEIKALYPDEYEKRGRDILRYKRGAESENYYDLQYRVMKELRRVSEAEAKRGAEDIVIVAHLGVIRIIMANLKGTSLEEALRENIPRGSVNILSWPCDSRPDPNV
ncbi:MAG: histidine phosphatase family protein [Clostridiales Family XIII bacterium]|nr:histidine phosphatase family protein [Clostridiales Family XIII bacterium]